MPIVTLDALAARHHLHSTSRGDPAVERVAGKGPGPEVIELAKLRQIGEPRDPSQQDPVGTGLLGDLRLDTVDDVAKQPSRRLGSGRKRRRGQRRDTCLLRVGVGDLR